MITDEDAMAAWYALAEVDVPPSRHDGCWAVWNAHVDDPRAAGDGWAWTVVASPDGVSHQNIWPGPKTAKQARALAAALSSAATWHDRVRRDQ